jgi:hypothetical protein
VSSKIALLTKMAGVVLLCLSLTGCPFFCICSLILVERGSNSAGKLNFNWQSLLGDCGGEDYICPSSGFWGTDRSVPCVPGVLNPMEPSLLTPEALGAPWSTSSSAVAEDVQASLTGLPQSPPPSQRVLTPSPPARIDCTDPANAGRGQCAGTNRQNKPLYPPGN